MQTKTLSIAAALLAVTAAPLTTVISAHATTLVVPVNCAGLDAELGNPQQPGETILLHDSALCTGAHTIKQGAEITLKGQAATDGFDGGGINQILTGSDNGATTISNLIFKNGKSTGNGGAIYLTQSTGTGSPTITMDSFFNNQAKFSGGAVEISLQTTGSTVTVTHDTFGGPGAGNTSTQGVGGGIEIVALGNEVVTDNVIANNSAGFSGGGAFLDAGAATGSIDFERNVVSDNQVRPGNGGGVQMLTSGAVTINGNVFRNNLIQGGSGGQNRGGGLAVQQATGKVVNQAHNLFANNIVRTVNAGGATQPRQVGNQFDFGGAGEFAFATTINSLDDTYQNNAVGDAGFQTGAVGGGLAVTGLNGNKATLHATNLVATNNTVGAKGEGGGIYAGFSEGCNTPPCPAEIDLSDSTVSGNNVGATGSGAGLSGDVTTDIANVVNSIVYGNTGTTAQIESFKTITVNHSDSCQSAGTPYPGTGNICVDPKLVNVAGNDVHETATSPTVNAGDSAQVPSGVTSDYEGDGRVQGASVDIGADEFTPAVIVAPTPSPTPALPKAGTAGGRTSTPSTVPAVVLLVLCAGAGVALSRRRAL